MCLSFRGPRGFSLSLDSFWISADPQFDLRFSLHRFSPLPLSFHLISSILATGTVDSTISMVTSKVVDAGLSSLFQGLFDKLAPPFLKSLGFLFGVGGEADKLKSAFSRIQALLNDAEERQIKDELIRLWLRELKDAAYDAEDILDEVEYGVLRSKLEEPMQTRKRKRDQVSDLFSRFVSNLNLGPRMKEMIERLEEIESRSNHLHLKVILKSEMLIPGMRHPTSSIIDESIVFGRETDREKVVGLLTSDDNSSAANSGIEIVPICGMGGLGKTTLAQLAYNDERVVKHFVVKAWVYVSEDFDLMRLTKAIAESVPGSKPHLTNLDAIQVSIKEALKEKRFLLVLDDVWTEDFDDWLKLRAPLIFGARGSRILVTTRSQKVSSNMGTVPTHFLQGLSNDDCWSLFERRAFLEGDSDAHPDLVKIGKEIVNKCKGLPLAVKTLGGLLRSKLEVVDWKSILESELWDLPEERNDILPALRLSYYHLPAHLKRCFAYGCILLNKKGSDATGDELILIWIAQGFIQSRGSMQMEEVGREYLDDLCSRSLLNRQEHWPSDYIYTMHDLTHDLARSVLGAEFLEMGDGKPDTNVEKVRHLSCQSFRFSTESFKDLYCSKNLRTFSLQVLHHHFLEDHVRTIPADLFINLRHLRILNFRRNHITELPESIGNLLQLRYLDLSQAFIKRLPKSTTKLYNLQTLILADCIKLVQIPSDLSNLVNLRHLNLHRNHITELPESIGNLLQLRYLDLSETFIKGLPKSTSRLYNLRTLILVGCSQLVELPSDLCNLVNLRHLSLFACPVSIPPRIGRLTSLQKLKEFKVGKEIGYGISELKDMIHLQGSLCISELENVVNVEEAIEAELKNKQKIGELQLKWKSDDVEFRQKGIDEEVLSGLEPHTNLQNLKIEGYCGVTFPTWLGDSSFSKLTRVTLYSCRCRFLPPFGQLPSLKYLCFRELYGLKKVGREFCGDGTVKGFPSLEILCFGSMSDLEECSGLEGDISHVHQIDIRQCSKLRELPCFPPTLTKVTIYECEKLATFPSVPSICDLTLSGCDERILSSLQYLTSLSSLEISEFPNLTSLPNGVLQSLTALKVLRIRYFHQLKSLSKEVGLQHLTSLRYLEICGCPQLTYIGDEVLPVTLRHLEILKCRNLNCLPPGLQNLTSLVILSIVYCPNIHSLPEELPTTLEELYISQCPILQENCQEGGEYWLIDALEMLHVQRRLKNVADIDSTGASECLLDFTNVSTIDIIFKSREALIQWTQDVRKKRGLVHLEYLGILSILFLILLSGKNPLQTTNKKKRTLSTCPLLQSPKVSTYDPFDLCTNTYPPVYTFLIEWWGAFVHDTLQVSTCN
ncbi:putative disease resistance protein RGA1 [Cinnamomum micranthum f. kanehirae]|uniref:Putative disease resistance protein RGA1 n=1 Tax=Cinnamomum micranthum f. kanehirae TaxID=337451 RepID=A0A443NMN7_9MAGN|nr:putative disease resistance protein RGA1 [Cinnamomum micranthum f. kanehirae]